MKTHGKTIMGIRLSCEHMSFIIIKMLEKDSKYYETYITWDRDIQMILYNITNKKNEYDIEEKIPLYLKINILKTIGIRENKIKNNGEICMICLTEMKNNEEILECERCKNKNHLECMLRWICRSTECIYCRTTMLKSV